MFSKWDHINVMKYGIKVKHIPSRRVSDQKSTTTAPHELNKQARTAIASREAMDGLLRLLNLCKNIYSTYYYYDKIRCLPKEE